MYNTNSWKRTYYLCPSGLWSIKLECKFVILMQFKIVPLDIL